MFLTGKGKEERGIFESLQEEQTMNEYGNILGRLICMYLRMLDQEEEFGVVDHDLTACQRQKIQDLKDVLIEGSAEDSEMDARFHNVLRELFLWKESHYHYNPVTEPFSTSIIWSLWSLLMCGTSRSDQMCVTEPPWLLLNPPGLD